MVPNTQSGAFHKGKNGEWRTLSLKTLIYVYLKRHPLLCFFCLATKLELILLTRNTANRGKTNQCKNINHKNCIIPYFHYNSESFLFFHSFISFFFFAYGKWNSFFFSLISIVRSFSFSFLYNILFELCLSVCVHVSLSAANKLNLYIFITISVCECFPKAFFCQIFFLSLFSLHFRPYSAFSFP